MNKKLSLLIYYFLKIFNKIYNFLTKKSFLIWIKNFLENDSYKTIQLFGSDLVFFIPNELTEWRVNTFLLKEPETIEWIDSFENKNSLIFWDIGANIGLYSIYNALKNKKSLTISFEPSSSNLRVLSRNISINNLEKYIKIFPIALNNKSNSFLQMNENEFIEGGALNSFGSNLNFEGKKFSPKMKYNTFGTTINYLLENKILDIPDYIKIDVDGLEHVILAGADKFLDNKKIKSILVEINENYIEQYKNVLEVMRRNKFKLLHKKQNSEFLPKGSIFSKTFNYIFNKDVN